jgi:hypothetical protein
MAVRSPAIDAKLIFEGWKTNSRPVTLFSAGPPIQIVASGRVEDVTFNDEHNFFVTFSVGNATFDFDFDGAEFEYQEPREAPLASLGLSPDNCVCCLSIGIDGARRLIPEPFGVVRLFLCELA